MNTKELLEEIARVKKEGDTRLELRGHRLTELPSELFELTHLTRLSLNRNKLKELPEEIASLSNLQVLSLTGNQLSNLPNSIVKLKNLQKLSLDINQFAVFPEVITNLVQLKRLSLDLNQLTQIPQDIGNLTELEELDLSNNQLKEIPDTIYKLPHLAYLSLRGNLLNSISPDLSRLSGLQVLDLSLNKLSVLPDIFNHLTQLKILDIRANQLVYLPASMSHLQVLQTLYLSHNLFSHIPELLIHLKDLQTLDVSGNKLTNIPEFLIYLENLKVLGLNNNQITYLPAFLQKTSLNSFDIRGNPLPLTPELLEEKTDWGSHTKPPQVIFDIYFGNCKPLHEAKLLIVGEPEVGKTSVIYQLLHNQFDNIQSKTDGIEIHRWQIPVQDHTVQVNIWDFGGQEIYRSTHQFFFTKRSLYVVVVSGRQDDSKVLEKWLKTVQQLAGEQAPVVVVVNKIDEYLPPLDERGLRLKYPQIAGFAYLSCKDNYMMVNGQKQKGVGSLTALIQQTIDVLPHVNDLLHEAWWNVKHTLQNTPYDVFSYDQFVEVCEQNLVKTDYAQKILAQLLHDLGAIVHFQDDPRLENTNVLNPEWVTQGVYAILNSEKIKKQQGQLRLEDLKEVLDKDKYPTRRHPYLIELMQRFQLCFTLPSRDNCYLIPALLPPEQPVFTWPTKNSLALEYQYEDFLPDTILLWLMAQTYEKLDLSRTWRTGFVLQIKEGDTVVNEALVKGDEADRRLSISVTGRESTRRNLLAIIRDRLVDIHARFQKLPFQEMCPAVDVAGNVVGLISYRHLLRLEGRKRLIHYDPESDKDIDVQASLNLVEEPEQRAMVELRDYLLSKYNLEEVKTLLFDLGWNAEAYISMNQGYQGIVQELVQYAKRTGRLGLIRSEAYKRREGI